MRYNVRGQRLEITDALRNYVIKKLGRIERYFETPPTSDVNVTLSVTKGQQAVEVTIPIPSAILRAEEKSDDMYASIDHVTDKLERQIRKYKTKINRKAREQGSLRAFFKEDFEHRTVSTLTCEEQEDEQEFELVRTKRFNLLPMEVDDAIWQMNLIGHSFYVFINKDSKEVNIVYRRDDEKYGLIEAQ